MLDVHPPHKAIHGTGEFFLHLFTITVGLLIAVGIEGAVTRHEHTKLAQEAAETMTAEIRGNLSRTEEGVRDIETHQKKLEENLKQLQKVQENPTGPEAENLNIDASFNTFGLENQAWHTAQATNALAYMPYEQAQRFSGIYSLAEALGTAQDKIAEDEAQFLGVVRRYPDYKGRTTKEGADAMAERFGVWQGHLLSVHIAAMVLREHEKAFLENREPAHHMSEKIGN